MYKTENLRPSDRLPVLARIDPDQASAGNVDSIWVNAGKVRSLLALVLVGDLGASATIDAKLRQATDSSGTGAKDITGKVITQITTTGDKIALINLRAEELDINNSYNHVSLRITVGTAASEIGGVLLGLDPHYQPLAHIAAVAEVIS